MPQLIDFEIWALLHHQAEMVYSYARDLETYSRLEAQPPVAFLDEYREEFGKLIKIINDTRDQCEAVEELLSHDVLSYLNPLYGAFHKIGRKKYQEAWDKLRSNMCIHLIIRNVIDALKFYVDEQLEVRAVAVAGFLLEIKPSLECVFYDFGRYREGKKLSFVIHDHLKAFMHEGTLANLLQNICLNARKHGQASQVIIEIKNYNNCVKITLVDDGKGIDSSSEYWDCDDIFESGISRSGSKGIGLSSAKQKMHLMGGNIFCFGHGGLKNKETRSRGARFEIILPKVQTET